MKNIFIFFIVILFACISCQEKREIARSSRTKTLFNSDWLFHHGDIESAEQVAFNDRSWRKLSLPHDWSIEDIPGTDSPLDSNAIGSYSNGFFAGGTSWYRKHFELNEAQKNKKLYLQFDGIYMNADVWINGYHLGFHPYGYTSFGYDITDNVLQIGDNVLVVEVKNEGQNSRWYSGSGIYRHVWLTATNSIYVPNWGVSINTPEVSTDSASIQAVIKLKNETESHEKLMVFSSIYDADGVMRSQTNNSLIVKSQSSSEIIQNFEVEHPRLWSLNIPNLYKIFTQVLIGDEVLDEVENSFGIRSILFNIKDGFLLNGVPTLLKGGCMHHGNGPLGAAAYDRAEERRVELMKNSGFNAIRCSHNPPSKAFLDACDRLGIMVIDEAFDMWKKPKNTEDYHLYFDDWWQRDIEAMVLRDRNHPSIIMWSTGNEIPERGESDGVQRSIMLSNYIKVLDPTRPVTAAVNGLNPDKDPYFATLDISGYNYATGGDHWKRNIYQLDHSRVPDRIMYGAESYPLEAFGAWMDVLDNTYVIGDFVWTGFDYLGEASIGWNGYMLKREYYPWSHAFCGDIDICGWKQPQSYYRDVLWEVGEKPHIFVVPPQPTFPINNEKMSWSKWEWHDVVSSWNWYGYEGKIVEVKVYNRSEEVELFLNDVSLGRKETNRGNEWIASWFVPYEKGILKALNYNGKDTLTYNDLSTSGIPSSIKLTADRTEIKADGFDLSYIDVEIVDDKGIRNPTIEQLVNFDIQGPGEIIAVASSNPMTRESYQKPFRYTYNGRCLAIVKSTKERGQITLKAVSDELPEAAVIIHSVN